MGVQLKRQTSGKRVHGPFFYRHGQNQAGPLSLESLREHAARGEFGPRDLVWAEGLPDWQPAQKFPGLFPVNRPTPEAQAAPDSPDNKIEPPPLPAAPVAASPSNPFVQHVLAELHETFQACLDQAQRVYALGFGAYDSRRIDQDAGAAQEALGQRLEAAGLGDAALRKQLVELVERQKSVEAAKASIKLLLAERRGLYLRLAEPFLNGPPPAGMEVEHKQAVTLREDALQAGARQSQQRRSLLPVEPRERLRVAMGYGVLAIVLLFVAWWAFGGRSRGGDPLRNLPRATYPGKMQSTPVELVKGPGP